MLNVQTIEKNKAMNTDRATEAAEVSAADNVKQSNEPRNNDEPSKEVRTEMKEEVAQKNKLPAADKAALKAKLMHSILNSDQIKAEEAEARAKVRDEEGEVLHVFHNRKIVRISDNLVVKK